MKKINVGSLDKLKIPRLLIDDLSEMTFKVKTLHIGPTNGNDLEHNSTLQEDESKSSKSSILESKIVMSQSFLRNNLWNLPDMMHLVLKVSDDKELTEDLVMILSTGKIVKLTVRNMCINPQSIQVI